MKHNVTEAEIEQFAHYNMASVKARGGTVMGFACYLSGARTHFAMGGTMPPAAAEFGKQAPEPPKAPAQASLALLTPIPPRSVAPPVPAAVVADRVRMAALIAMTAKGAEAEADCQEAIRTGASVEQYASTVAARSILNARRAARTG